MDNYQIQPLPFRKLSFSLSGKALDFLAGTTNGVSHFAIYHAMLGNMNPGFNEIFKRGISIKMRPYQADESVNALSAKFGLGRKVITRLLTTMCQLGIINLTFSKLITIADMLDVFAYEDDAPCQESLEKAVADDIVGFTDILESEGGAENTFENCLSGNDETLGSDTLYDHVFIERIPGMNKDHNSESELPY